MAGAARTSTSSQIPSIFPLDPIRTSDQLIWACRKSLNMMAVRKHDLCQLTTGAGFDIRTIVRNDLPVMKNSNLCRPALIIAGLAGFLSLISASADTIYVGCALEGTIHQFTTNGVGSIFARASLGNPEGEAFDRAGNLYVANEGHNTITRFTTSGVPSLFYADPGDGSILNNPTGLAFDKAGNLYVANDANNNIEKFDTNGVPSVFATDDGSGNILNGPEGLAFDTSSNLYVANDGNFISKFSPNGTFFGQFGDSSYLNSPVGVAFDSGGNLYVANSVDVNNSPTIAKFNTAGNGSVFADTNMNYPEFIAFDTNNNLYVANEGGLATEGSNNIVKFDTSGNGTVFSQYGGTAFPFGLAFDHSGNLYEADNGQFIQEFDTNGYSSRFATISIADPRGIGLDSAGNLYVANYTAGTIEKFDTNSVPSVFAFAGGLPYGLVVDGSNNVYMAASYNNQILKFAPNGSSSIFGTDDGSGLILNTPWGLAIDSLGNIYAINGNVNTMSKFTPNGSSSVFASPADFYTHGPGLAADSSNNIYCLTNFTAIAKFSSAGVPAPFANDPGQSYAYANAQGMAFDSAGNLYVANYYDGTVMKFDKNGNGSVFATNLDTPESIVIKRPNTATFIPTLFITPSGTNVVLSWSTAAAGYNLYSKTNLALGNWLAVPGIRGTNLTSFLMTNPITGSAKFFRLSNP
jgi:DNA-binding beta-propeller fold protein YncE